MKLLHPLAKRFIAGDSLGSAKPEILRLIENGYEVSVDYIGENSKTYAQARKAYKQYCQIITELSDYKIDISIKPSQVGLNVHPHLAYIILHNLAKRAAKVGHTIRLDMEDSSVTSLTRNLAISVNGKHGNCGVAIQANLFRTEEDLNILISKGVSVRLVKGAYKESKEIAHQTQEAIGSSFFHYAATLYSSKANKPAVGTHDEELLEDIEELIPDPNYYEYEFLYGIRRDLQKRYRDEGRKVRVYIPFGTDWFPYCVRRLKEWKNLKFVFTNVLKELPIQKLLKDIRLLFLFGVLVFLFTYGYKTFFVLGDSMSPSNKNLQPVLVDKLYYKFETPKEGDVIVFYLPDDDEFMLKRVIGLPGDVIQIVDGYIYKNGYLYFDEFSYVRICDCISHDEERVREGEYWVIGDNRDESWYGIIYEDEIIGKLK